MAKSRHRGAFVFGSILGGAVGAVAALWNTPQSGEDLRRKLGFESEAGRSVTAAAYSAKPLSNRALGLVERAAAPLVGVKLGHTANHSQPGDAGAPSVDPEPGVVRREPALIDVRPSDGGASA